MFYRQINCPLPDCSGRIKWRFLWWKGESECIYQHFAYVCRECKSEAGYLAKELIWDD